MNTSAILSRTCCRSIIQADSFVAGTDSGPLPPATNPGADRDELEGRQKERPPEAGFLKTAVWAFAIPNMAGFATRCKSLLAG